MSMLTDRARALVGRTVTVTLTGVPSEPHPITGRLGQVVGDAYLDLVDVPGRDRPTVRIMLDTIAAIAPAGGGETAVDTA